MPLPPFPAIELVEVEDLSPREQGEGFLRLGRTRLRVRSANGALSEPFVYDHVDRVALDAVVVVAHHRDERGQTMVYLRSALRPPPRMRAPHQRPLAEKPTLGLLWEVVAGLVEPDECNETGLRRSAQRELEEELGFQVELSAIAPLGPSAFPCPGVLGERHHYFHVEVDPEARREPSEDGSVLERDAVITTLTLAAALDAVRRGDIEDSKTEIALRRLAEIVP